VVEEPAELDVWVLVRGVVSVPPVVGRATPPPLTACTTRGRTTVRCTRRFATAWPAGGGVGRAFAASWADSSGNLYLFGGAGGSGQIGTLFNDLWKYSVSTGQWAWIAGTNGTAGVGVYGTKGTSAASNLPGGRFSSSTWIDGSGNLWLFGGNGFDSAATSTNALNDLWKYQP